MAFLSEIFGRRLELPDGSHIDGLADNLANDVGDDADDFVDTETVSKSFLRLHAQAEGLSLQLADLIEGATRGYAADVWALNDLTAAVEDEISLERLTKADRSHLVRKVIRNKLGRRQVVWVKPQQADQGGEKKQAEGQEQEAPRTKTREQVDESRSIIAAAVGNPNRINPEQLRELANHIDAITKEEAKGLLKQLGERLGGDQVAVAGRLLAAIRAGRDEGKAVGAGLAEGREAGDHLPTMDRVRAARAAVEAAGGPSKAPLAVADELRQAESAHRQATRADFGRRAKDQELAQPTSVRGKPELTGPSTRVVNWARGERKKVLDQFAGGPLEDAARDYFEKLTTAEQILDNRDKHAANIRAMGAGEKPAELQPEAKPEAIGKQSVDASKIIRDVRGKMEINQQRAKAGGEEGPNGEWYPGGAFIATQDVPKKIKDKLKQKATGRVRVRNGYEQPSPGQMSIADKLGGTVMDPRTGEVNEQYLDYIKATPEERQMYSALSDKYKSGEDWVDINDYPQLARLEDVARLYAAGKPVPGDALQSLPEEYRSALKKWEPKQANSTPSSEQPAERSASKPEPKQPEPKPTPKTRDQLTYLPKDPKRLSIDQAEQALADLGYDVRPTGGQSGHPADNRVYVGTGPDGQEVELHVGQVKAAIYGEQALPLASKISPDSIKNAYLQATGNRIVGPANITGGKVVSWRVKNPDGEGEITLTDDEVRQSLVESGWARGAGGGKSEPPSAGTPAPKTPPQNPAPAVDNPAPAGNTTPVPQQSAGANQGGSGMSNKFQYTINNPSSPLNGQTLTFRNKYKAPVNGELVDVIEFEPITHNGKTYDKPIISINKYPDAFKQHAAHEQEQRAAKATADAERQASLAATIAGWSDVKSAVDERVNDGAQAFGRQGMDRLNALRQKYPAAYLWHYADQQERTAHWSSTEKRERMQRVKNHIEAGDIEAATAELNAAGVKNPFTN